jgi:Arc/MetJ-type ribon-helix-helix transcriptional regulator
MMPKSIPVEQKRRGRPRTGSDPLFGFRAPQELVAAIDAWSADQPERRSRSEAIRYIIEDWLTANGRWPAKPESEANGR